MAYLLGGEILKIYIYPLGGISKFRFDLNTSIFKEFLVLISGPIFQIITYIILKNTMINNKEIITIYHYSILFFNLLPIYPLDGGKLLNLFLSLFTSYKRSLILSIILSIISTTIILIFGLLNTIKTNLVIISIFLIYKIIIEYKQINYIYEKFLLERYLKNYSFKKGIIVNNINKLRRGKRHLIKIGDSYYYEREILEKKYKKYWLLNFLCAIIYLST